MVGSSRISNLFCDFVFDCDLSQLVSAPTHRMGNCLDLVLTNFPQEINNLSVYTNSILKSDHYSISFSLCQSLTSFLPNTQSPSYVPDFSKLDFNALAEYLFYFDFSPCFTCLDVELVWSQLKAIIINAVHLFAPSVKLKSKTCFPKWYTPEIKHLINRTRYFRRRVKLSPTLSNIARLESEERHLFQLMSATKLNFEADLVNKFAYSNDGKIYKYINSILKCNSLPVYACI